MVGIKIQGCADRGRGDVTLLQCLWNSWSCSKYISVNLESLMKFQSAIHSFNWSWLVVVDFFTVIRTVERGVTRVVTRGPGALRGPVENTVCIFGYEFSISSIGRAGPWADWYLKFNLSTRDQQAGLWWGPFPMTCSVKDLEIQIQVFQGRWFQNSCLLQSI